MTFLGRINETKKQLKIVLDVRINMLNSMQISGLSCYA